MCAVTKVERERRASGEAARREKRGRQPEKKKENLIGYG